ncbi:MAG: PrsW family glutamic-type intramembrane protease [Anaerolineaceae bacterium]
MTTAANPIYSNGIAILTIGIILLPFVVLKIKTLSYHQVSTVVGRRFSLSYSPFLLLMLIFLWGLLLLVGYYIIGIKLVSVLLTPFLASLAIIVPIVIYLSITQGRGDLITHSRGWGALSVGVVAAPMLGNLVEFGIVAITLIILVIVIMQNPLSMSSLESTANRLSSAQTNPEIINNIVSSFIRQPVNKYLVLAFVSGFIPIVEEAVKQTPIWLLAWRKLTPRAGLIIGALGGAGFALTESLLTVSVIGDSNLWLIQMIGRAGTGLMHITTGAISGWGLASAIGGRGYLKSAGFYLIAIIIHGIWNGLAIWEGIGRLINNSLLTSWQFNGKGLIPSLLLGGLFLVMLLFWIMNKKILKD